MAYLGVARLLRIEPDPASADRHYAVVSDYLPFDRPVPMSSGGLFYEKRLRGVPSTRRGVTLQGKSMRPIGEDEFGAIDTDMIRPLPSGPGRWLVITAALPSR